MASVLEILAAMADHLPRWGHRTVFYPFFFGCAGGWVAYEAIARREKLGSRSHASRDRLVLSGVLAFMGLLGILFGIGVARSKMAVVYYPHSLAAMPAPTLLLLLATWVGLLKRPI